jgi:hypothetical protein
MEKTAALGLIVATAVATSASAGLVELAGDASTTLPATGTGTGFYDVQDVSGSPDPWGAGTLLVTEVTSLLGPAATTVELTYRGNESSFDNTLATADGTTVFTANRTTPGTTAELTTVDFLGLGFLSDGTGSPIGLSSAQVGVTAVANVLEIGFNDGSPLDADYDDLRFSAVVTPIPAPLALLATGATALWWGRRRRRAVT